MIDNTIRLQHFLFEQGLPSRKALLEYCPQNPSKYKICVYRNHSFELVEHVLGAYLDFSDCVSSFFYSDYDDSLSFLNFDYTADLAIIWLDLSRYNEIKDLNNFISERIQYLSEKFQKPILFVYCGGKIEINIQNALSFNLNSIDALPDNKLYDDRMSCISGTRLSSKAIMLIARELGLKYIPASVKPSLKAIAVDLDNTLYKGILGEDGIDKLELTDGHSRLQKVLKNLKNEGFFLCVLSKNDASDVEKLFTIRQDFPLSREDFVSIQASWNEKSEMLSNALRLMNIHYDSVLFIDDNMGELNMMDIKYPSIHCIRACDNADVTADIVENYPGLNKFNIIAEDALRTADTISNMKRTLLKNTLSPLEYLKSLDVNLRFGIDEDFTVERVAQLANKTNQFIFGYGRYTVQQVAHMIADKTYAVITVSLKDKLSDSGLIGVCVAHLNSNIISVEEIFVSCRALGRGLDDMIVLGAIEQACRKLNCRNVKVKFVKGERNVPAENFANDKLANFLNDANYFKYDLPENVVKIDIQGRI